MTNNKFEEFFKNRLLKYSSPVPGDMWERIQGKKKKDRILFFILWFVSICLIVFLSNLIYHSNKNIVDNNPVSNKELNIKSLNAPDKIVENTPANKVINAIPTALNLFKVNKNSSTQFKNKKEREFIYREKIDKDSSSIKIFESIQKADIADLTSNNSQDDVIEKEADTPIKHLTQFLSSKDSSTHKKSDPLMNKKESKILAHRNKSWTLEIQVSPDIPFFERTYKNFNFNQHPKNAPTSFTIGIKAGKYLGKHLLIKTGIQYSQISEKFFDSLIVVDHYRSIDIPILVGYRFNDKSFNTTINAGVIYNIYSWYKESTLIDYRAIMDVAKFYKQNTGFSLYLGANLSKQINNNFEVLAEPYFRYRLSYMTKPSAPFIQKINIAGFNIGLRFKF